MAIEKYLCLEPEMYLVMNILCLYPFFDYINGKLVYISIGVCCYVYAILDYPKKTIAEQ